MTHPIIIIGAGLAGWTTAREFRKLDTTTPVMVVTADSGDFYAKPSLSNALNQGRTPRQLVSTPAAKMMETLNVRLLAHTQVSAIDPVARTIATTQGEFGYSQLVLATGARPIRVALAGDAAGAVQSVNSLDDFAKFHAALLPVDGHQGGESEASAPVSKHVLIMGAGLIGCEFANDLAASGHRVTVVDPSAGPISALLPQDASAQLRTALQEIGVRWQFGATVVAVNQTVGAFVPGLQVTLSDAQEIQVDMVLSAIGLRADLGLAQAAGLACERGVVVDRILQTSHAHVYALGDGAQYAPGMWHRGERTESTGATDVTGGRTMPYVMPIMAAAKALANTLTGTPTNVIFPLMPVSIKTPALPVVVAPPVPGTLGQWRCQQVGIWQFIDEQGQARGFVLTGQHTSRRAEQVKLLAT